VQDEQQINLKDVAIAIRNYAVSRNRFDWREVEDRLSAVEAHHDQMAANLGLKIKFADRLARWDAREPLRAIFSETAGLFGTLRTIANLDWELQTKELEKIVDRLEYLDFDLAREQNRWNKNILEEDR
jgi:hypothetical protein